ncbi:MAG: Ig-like domain-containing protein, partial [Candidatus Latescibacterota bacterium]
MVQLNVSPNERLRVQDGTSAAFTLSMSNLSESDETGVYLLQAVTERNPHGAVLKVNGRPLIAPIPYRIPAFETQEITLTVERGPQRAEYEQLAIMAVGAGETETKYAGNGDFAFHDGLSDTSFVSVEFVVPVSGVDLIRPLDNWVFDGAMSEDWGERDTVEVILDNFNLEISKGDSLEFVGVEYRAQGSAKWEDIGLTPRSELKEGWGVAYGGDVTAEGENGKPGISDGVYEVRAYTLGAGGNRGYSDVVTRIIDRSVPMVFGKPEPSDGILSLGEEISITFNEPVNCNPDSVADRVTLHFYDPTSEDQFGDPIGVEAVCDGQTLILTPTLAAEALEGKELIAEVKGLRDATGNMMQGEKRWIFGVRQSAFTWRQASLTTSVETGQVSTLDAEIVNGTTAIVDFTLDTPEWLVPSISSVKLPQGETQAIRFAVRSDLEDGVYHETIKAVNSDGSTADLHIKLIVVPDWQVTPSDYQYSMTVMAQVEVPDVLNDGTWVLSDDPDDQVAAYVGSELRGVASVAEMGGDYFAFLTVYSNVVQGEKVRLKVWDDSEGMPYETNVNALPFLTNTLVGSPQAPEEIRAITDVSDLPLLQEIDLNAGWTWFSTQVDLRNVPLNNALASLTPDNGDVLRYRDTDAAFARNSWADGITFVPGRGYALKMAKADTLVFEGSRVAFDTPIDLQSGWNWIGFTATEPIEINAALVGLQAKDGDWILSQSAFAQYSGGKWWGSLTALKPAEGYRLFMFLPKQSRFEFSLPADPSAKPLLATKPVLAKDAPDWTVNERAYPYQMAVVAQLSVEGASAIDPTDMIGAFVGDELRGMAQPVEIPGQDAPVAFLMVHG